MSVEIPTPQVSPKQFVEMLKKRYSLTIPPNEIDQKASPLPEQASSLVDLIIWRLLLGAWASVEEFNVEVKRGLNYPEILEEERRLKDIEELKQETEPKEVPPRKRPYLTPIEENIRVINPPTGEPEEIDLFNKTVTAIMGGEKDRVPFGHRNGGNGKRGNGHRH